MFQINDKVVCVDDSGQFDDWDAVRHGETYVVRGISSQGGPYLVGLCAGYWYDGEEVSFASIRFRKLTDIQAENAAKHADACSA